MKAYDSFAAADVADPYSNSTEVIGGIVWTSETEYNLRLGLRERDMEARTDNLFSQSIVSFRPPEPCPQYGTKDDWGSGDPDEPFGGSCVENRYKYFLIFQTVVDNAILQTKSSDASWLPVTKDEMCSVKTLMADQGMDVKPIIGDISFFQVIQLFLTPICTIFSFAFTVPLVLKRIVEEKQQGVKELMKMMGLPNWLHWVGWFTITGFVSIITISIMVTVIVAGKIFEHVNPLVLFLSLFLYGFSTICFNFATSTLFSNRK